MLTIVDLSRNEKLSSSDMGKAGGSIGGGALGKPTQSCMTTGDFWNDGRPALAPWLGAVTGER